jgi:hypothetical protein
MATAVSSASDFVLKQYGITVSNARRILSLALPYTKGECAASGPKENS